MAAQTLETIIRLSGRVDSAAMLSISNTINGIGEQIDQIGSKLRSWGVQDLQEYAQYDDLMREVQALGQYDDKTIETLNAYNRSVAQSSRYTMADIAETEKLIAQLGLSYEQMTTLMPSVMSMATAGNISMADSLDYLYYSLSAMGLPMTYANTLADQMALTSAKSAADINTLGESLQRLGSTSKFFTGGSSEVLAILGGIAQFGQDMQGTAAGTQLRNFMLTLIAPTGTKSDILDSLGVTEEELAEFQEYAEEAELDLAKTQEAMQKLGFSVYDQSGNLKPGIQILTELRDAMADMSEEDRNQTLGDLFGKRTTTTALNLLNTLDEIIALQQEIEGGSSGYTQEMSETMEGGLGGATRRFEAAKNALQVAIGEALAPEATSALEGVTDLINSITNMDPDKLDTLVGALTGIAMTGPALMIAGTAMKGLTLLMTPQGALVAGTMLLGAGIGAYVSSMQDMGTEIDKNKFGDMSIQTAELTAHMNGLSQAFNDNWQDINAFSTAINEAVTSYQTASTEMSGSLMTAVITGMTLTPDDQQKLTDLAGQMNDALVSAITSKNEQTQSFWSLFFGSTDAEGNPVYGAILDANNLEYQSALANAEQLGADLRNALTAAFDDGEITEEERQKIMEVMRAYNRAMAEAAAMAQEEEAQIEMEKMLRRGQTVSLDSMQDYIDEVHTMRDQQTAQMTDTYEDARARAKLGWERAMREGTLIDGAPMTQERMDALLADMDRQQESKVQAQAWQSDQLIVRAMDSAIRDSEYGADYDRAMEEVGKILRGETTDFSLYSIPPAVQKYMQDMVNTAGGSYELLPESMRSYGPLDMMVQAYTLTHNPEQGMQVSYSEEMFRALGTVYKANAGGLMDLVGQILRGEDVSDDEWRQARSATNLGQLDTLLNNLMLTHDFGGILADYGISAESLGLGRDYTGFDDMAALYALVYGTEGLRDRQQAPEAGGDTQAAYEAGSEYAAQFQEGAESASPVLNPTLPDGSADGAAYASAYQRALNNQSPTMTVHVRTASAASEASEGSGPGGRSAGTTSYMAYGEGGRSDVPAVFGEAGPEWAIPEQHTPRTASLLNAARVASGVTWQEMVSAGGGAPASVTPWQLVYSPTIVANDASGVERKLLEDKKRLEDWMRDRALRDKMEVYA